MNECNLITEAPHNTESLEVGGEETVLFTSSRNSKAVDEPSSPDVQAVER